MSQALTLTAVQPLKFSEAQALAMWTAKKADEKAAALFACIAPALSSYLVNGGSKPALASPARAKGLIAAIHAGKTRKDKAARAVFAALLGDATNPGMFAAAGFKNDQTGHDAALEMLDMLFTAELAPAPKAPAKDKPAAKGLAATDADTAGEGEGTSTGAAQSVSTGPAFDVLAVAASIRALAIDAGDMAILHAALMDAGAALAAMSADAVIAAAGATVAA